MEFLKLFKKKNMENIKEKGLLRRFLEWLNKEDEVEINDSGEINEKAFKGEDTEILKILKEQSKKIDNMGNNIFIDRVKQRENTIKGMKAKVETPQITKKVVNEVEYEQEQ